MNADERIAHRHSSIANRLQFDSLVMTAASAAAGMAATSTHTTATTAVEAATSTMESAGRATHTRSMERAPISSMPTEGTQRTSATEAAASW